MIVLCEELLSLRLVTTIRDVLVKVPLQPQERLTNHVRFVGIILDTLYENSVVKIGNLLKVSEDQFLVVPNNTWRGRTVYLLDIALHNGLQVLAELLLRLD